MQVPRQVPLMTTSHVTRVTSVLKGLSVQDKLHVPHQDIEILLRVLPQLTVVHAPEVNIVPLVRLFLSLVLSVITAHQVLLFQLPAQEVPSATVKDLDNKLIVPSVGVEDTVLKQV